MIGSRRRFDTVTENRIMQTSKDLVSGSAPGRQEEILVCREGAKKGFF
jgi:hypothetical protein